MTEVLLPSRSDLARRIAKWIERLKTALPRRPVPDADELGPLRYRSYQVPRCYELLANADSRTEGHRISLLADWSEWVLLAHRLDRQSEVLDRLFGFEIDGIWSVQTQKTITALGIREDDLLLEGAYASFPQDWRCPCCLREKKHTVRRSRNSAKGLARIVVHHDHMVDFVHQTDKELIGRAPRFDSVSICDDCNVADAYVINAIANDGIEDFHIGFVSTKEHAASFRCRVPGRFGMRRAFSFSDDEIRSFTSPQLHGPHIVDEGKAREIYKRHFREIGEYEDAYRRTPRSVVGPYSQIRGGPPDTDMGGRVAARLGTNPRRTAEFLREMSISPKVTSRRGTMRFRPEQA